MDCFRCLTHNFDSRPFEHGDYIAASNALQEITGHLLENAQQLHEFDQSLIDAIAHPSNRKPPVALDKLVIPSRCFVMMVPTDIGK